MNFNFISVLIPWIIVSILFAVLVTGSVLWFIADKKRKVSEIKSNEHFRCLQDFALSYQKMADAVDRTGKFCTLMDDNIQELLKQAEENNRSQQKKLESITTTVQKLEEGHQMFAGEFSDTKSAMAKIDESLGIIGEHTHNIVSCVDEKSISRIVNLAVKNSLDEANQKRGKKSVKTKKEAESPNVIALQMQLDELQKRYQSCSRRESEIRKRIFSVISYLYDSKGSDSVGYLNDSIQDAIKDLNNILDEE